MDARKASAQSERGGGSSPAYDASGEHRSSTTDWASSSMPSAVQSGQSSAAFITEEAAAAAMNPGGSPPFGTGPCGAASATLDPGGSPPFGTGPCGVADCPGDDGRVAEHGSMGGVSSSGIVLPIETGVHVVGPEVGLQLVAANAHSGGRMPEDHGPCPARHKAVPATVDVDSDEEGYNVDNYERALAAAQSRAQPVLRLPWESGFLGVVLGGMDFQAAFAPPPTPFVLQAVPPPARGDSRGAGLRELEDRAVAVAKCRRSKLTEEEAEKSARAAAVARWMVVLRAAPTGSRLAAQLAERRLGMQEAEDLVAHTFAAKATSTVRARADSMVLFYRWASSCWSGSVAPLSEQMAYEYVCFLLRTRAPPTRAGRFREALWFANNVIGLQVEEGALTSPRVEGASILGMKEKMPVRQRPPLTLAQLVALEQIAGGGRGNDAVFAGFLCFMVHCRLRFSDAHEVVEEPLIDGHYLEATLGRTKTSRRATFAQQRISVTGIADGVANASWAAGWLVERQRTGLRAGRGVVFMPAPRADGWAKRRISNSEATLWMRDLLVKASVLDRSAEEPGLHSAKATLLAWCAKAGLDATTRRMLGGHMKPKDRSTVCYARDHMAAPLRKLRELLLNVRSGSFRPDQSRSGLWAEENEDDHLFGGPSVEEPTADQEWELAPAEPLPGNPGEAEEPTCVEPGPTVQATEVVPDSSDETGESSQGPDSTDDEGASGLEYELPPSRRAAASEGAQWVIHHARGTYHALAAGDAEKLACGRAMDASYVILEIKPAIAVPACRICFGRRLDMDSDADSG